MGGFDEDGLREVSAVAESEARRRQADKARVLKTKERQDDLRAAFAAGALTMAQYAKVAREAGISAAEVGAALQERAAAERRMSQIADAAQAKATQTDVSDAPKELAAALAAKAQGLERLRQGATVDAAEAFADAAALANEALAVAPASAADSARTVRVSCLLNGALCHLKLADWQAAQSACDAVIELDGTNVKAYYRRGTAQLRLGQPVNALADLEAAARLSPSDKDVVKMLAETRAALAMEGCMAAEAEVGGNTEKAGRAGEAAAVQETAQPASNTLSPVPALAPVVSAADAPGGASLRVPDVASRSFCYLDVSIGGQGAGRMTLQLFDDLVPRTVGNFRALVRGTDRAPDGSLLIPADNSPPLCYRGSPFHRIAKGFVLQGGDVVAGDGSGCVSALDDGEPFADESFAVPHARPGVLSMANAGPHTNGCQFFITLAAASACDGKHVAFGRLVGGMPLLRRIEALDVDDDARPLEPVVISGCGELTKEEAARFLPGDQGVGGVSGPMDMGGESLLHAASLGDLALMRSLISKGVSVDAFGCVTAPVIAASPLLTADGRVKVNSGGEADGEGGRESEEEETIECAALAVAARKGHVDMLRGLLGEGADADLVDSSGRCAIHWATLAGHTSCVEALLDGGAEASARDGHGRQAIHLAASYGHEGCLRLLIKRGQAAAVAGGPALDLEVEAGGLTPLHLAAAADCPTGVSALLDAGADRDTRAAAELTALHLAAAQGALGALATLLAAQSDYNLIGERTGKAALVRCSLRALLAAAALIAVPWRAPMLPANARSPSPISALGVRACSAYGRCCPPRRPCRRNGD